MNRRRHKTTVRPKVRSPTHPSGKKRISCRRWWKRRSKTCDPEPKEELRVLVGPHLSRYRNIFFERTMPPHLTTLQARLRALKSKPDDRGTLTTLRQLKYLQTGGGAGGDGAGGGGIGCSGEVHTAGEGGQETQR